MSTIVEDESLMEPTEVTHIWDDLGLTASEKEYAVECMKEEIKQIKRDYLEKLKARRDQIIVNIDRRKKTLATIIRSVKKPEEINESEIEALATKGTLRERCNELDAATKLYIHEYEKASEKFISVKVQTDELFNKLGYTTEERGEFNEIGYEDLSDERLDRFNDKKIELEQEVSKRIELLGRNEEKIKEILAELDEKMASNIQEIFEKNVIKVEAFETMEKYFDELQAIKHARHSKYVELAGKLSNLWELFETPDEEKRKFISSHQKLGTQCLQECFDEIQRLSQYKIDQLPSLIKRALERLDQACKFLHRIPEEEDELLQSIEDLKDNQQEYFEALNELCQHIQHEIILATPILKMIEQREEIEQAYQQFIQKESEIKKTELSKEDDIQLNIKADKAQRRHRFVLPRLEKKLYISLLEFKHATGYNFTYDGTEYITTLNENEIPLSLDDKRKAKICGRRLSVTANRKSLEGIPESKQRRKSEWPLIFND